MQKKHAIFVQSLLLMSGLFSIGLINSTSHPAVHASHVNSGQVIKPRLIMNNVRIPNQGRPSQLANSTQHSKWPPHKVQPKAHSRHRSRKTPSGRANRARPNRKPAQKQSTVPNNEAMDNRMAPVNNQAQEPRRNESYWTRRVNAYANARQPDYYPDITYNTRSLGMLPTANYKYAVNPGMLYRSANLHWINQRKADQLKKLHIHRDIDLRAWNGPNVSIHATPQPGEDKAMPDKYGVHIWYHHYPVENSREEAITYPYRHKYGEAYRFSYWYALSDNARKAYHNSLSYMLGARGPVIYNCTQGRDRTGTLSILIENILGVSRYNIYNDFLLTNHYKYQTNYRGQLARIDTFCNAINHKYGSMYRYERYGLNLSNVFMNSFRHKFLHRIR